MIEVSANSRRASARGPSYAAWTHGGTRGKDPLSSYGRSRRQDIIPSVITEAPHRNEKTRPGEGARGWRGHHQHERAEAHRCARKKIWDASFKARAYSTVRVEVSKTLREFQMTIFAKRAVRREGNWTHAIDEAARDGGESQESRQDARGFSGGSSKRVEPRAHHRGPPARACSTTSDNRPRIPDHQRQHQPLIRRLQRPSRRHSIVVTHDMKTAFYCEDRVGLLHEGARFTSTARSRETQGTQTRGSRFIEGRSGEIR